jgi:hypothetical protein
MLGRGVHPQALLFDSQPTEVRDDLKAACIQALRRALVHSNLANKVRVLRRRLEDTSDGSSQQRLVAKRTADLR